MPVMNIDGFNQFATFGCGIEAGNTYNVNDESYLDQRANITGSLALST